MLKIGKASAVNCRGRRFSSSEALELLGNRRSRSERSALAIAWEVQRARTVNVAWRST